MPEAIATIQGVARHTVSQQRVLQTMLCGDGAASQLLICDHCDKEGALHEAHSIQEPHTKLDPL